MASEFSPRLPMPSSWEAQALPTASWEAHTLPGKRMRFRAGPGSECASRRMKFSQVSITVSETAQKHYIVQFWGKGERQITPWLADGALERAPACCRLNRHHSMARQAQQLCPTRLQQHFPLVANEDLNDLRSSAADRAGKPNHALPQPSAVGGLSGALGASTHSFSLLIMVSRA